MPPSAAGYGVLPYGWDSSRHFPVLVCSRHEWKLPPSRKRPLKNLRESCSSALEYDRPNCCLLFSPAQTVPYAARAVALYDPCLEPAPPLQLVSCQIFRPKARTTLAVRWQWAAGIALA